MPPPEPDHWDLLLQLASDAPKTTGTLTIILLGIGFKIGGWFRNERIKTLEERINAKDEEIERLKQAPTTTATQPPDTYLRPEEDTATLVLAI